MRERTARNRDRLRQRAREDYAKHRESRIAKVHEYYTANREAINARRREEYPELRDKIQAQNRDYRSRPGVAARSAKYQRAYYIENREKIIAATKVYRISERGQHVFKAAHQREKQIHAHKIKARYFVANALRDGRLVRDNKCGDCGKKCKTQAHHHRGYERCFWLDVIWLCAVCHKAADKKQKD